MSALGGIIHADRAYVDPKQVLDMSRSLLIRKGEQRDAYLCGGVGLFYNRSLPEAPPHQRQPLTLFKNGKPYTLTLEGQITCMIHPSLSFSCQDPSAVADGILEAYLTMGAEFLPFLQGSFSLVIWDEERGEMLLARDPEGTYPIFYTVDEDSLFFASRIRGLLRCFPDGVAVCAERLRAHLTAPHGATRGETLYRDIFALPPGYCGIFSRMGLSLFPYGVLTEQKTVIPPETPPRTEAPFFCPSLSALRQDLTDALFAFDHPQFDPWMPTLLANLRQISEDTPDLSPSLRDPTLCVDLAYARERATYLAALHALPAPSFMPQISTPMELSFRQSGWR